MLCERGRHELPNGDPGSLVVRVAGLLRRVLAAIREHEQPSAGLVRVLSQIV